MKVDAMVCTYNSGPILEQVLKSIRKNIPVKTLWVIDKYSTDGTVEIAEKYGATIVQSNVGILEARALGFRLVETELFVNVDSDVVLPDDWFSKMMKYWEPDLGCLWGITIEQRTLHKDYIESMYKFRDPTSYNLTHLPNMIARKDILEDIHIPEALKGKSFGNDDAVILHWMKDVKKARVKNSPVRCKHYSYGGNLGIKTFWCGAGCRLTGLTKTRSVLVRSLFAFPQGVFAALVSRNANVIPYWIRFRFEYMVGFLKWSKYINLKRNKRGHTW